MRSLCGSKNKALTDGRFDYAMEWLFKGIDNYRVPTATTPDDYRSLLPQYIELDPL
jgi:hypothetical protein